MNSPVVHELKSSEKNKVVPSSAYFSKIQARHLERLAVVYIRQSTLRQIHENRESTEIQYSLVNRVQKLGWHPERILVIDEDQGKSGQSAEGRLGFQKLLAEVGLNHVGLILGVEMSRLARSNKDWHQLLELCALFYTLIADQDGLYDPTDYNDRLLLGMKGTLSEAEIHILRARMYQGKINKAKRGELLTHAPMGYIRDSNNTFVIDPDEQVQSVVKLIFDKFREYGTLNAVLQYLVTNKIKVGIRPKYGPNRGKLEWRRPCRATLQDFFHNPIYAGAYRYGHRPTDPRRKMAGRNNTGKTIVPDDQCLVIIQNRFPAYISWEQYQENLERLRQNRAKAEAFGAVREGPAILSGIILCGRCGHRMAATYSTAQSSFRYHCMRDLIDYGGPRCQSLRGEGLDELVSQQILQVLEPAAVQLSIVAADYLRKENERLENHWQQRLERAQYEADRAYRQFEAVEPENRLVGRELERRWESSLSNQKNIQEEHERFKKQHAVSVALEDKTRLLALSSDIQSLWNSPTTTPKNRQRVARFLLKRVVVTVENQSEKVQVHLNWVGDYVSQHEYIRPVANYSQLSNYKNLLSRIKELYDKKLGPQQIADLLNAEGWKPPKRRPTFNGPMISPLLSRICRTTYRAGGHPEGVRLKAHEYWLPDLARKLDMPFVTVYNWLKRGWISGRQMGGYQGQWILWADEGEVDRLKKLRTRHRGWALGPVPDELFTPRKHYRYDRKKAA